MIIVSIEGIFQVIADLHNLNHMGMLFDILPIQNIHFLLKLSLMNC